MTILQTTISCALFYSILSRDTTTDYLRCSILSSDATTAYPLSRLHLYGDTTNKHLLCSILLYSVLRYYLQPFLCGVLLCLAMLQATIQPSGYPLSRVHLYGDTTNDLLLWSTLSGDTVTDYPMCCTLSIDSTSDYPIYRLSALICIGILQTMICCALLYSVSRYYNRLSAVLYSIWRCYK
jgi:hypothetical protein